VVDKVRESRIITSFHLQPVERDSWRPFEPGQFLVLRIPEQGDRRPVPRSYSVSSSPYRRGHYRITVKRETAPAPGVPEGVGSCWLHDKVNVGDVIQASGPRGEFALDRKSQRPVVLLAGGVGLTPLVSMLHALKDEPARQVCFIHACDNGEVQALRDEVLFLSRSRRGIDVHFCYRFPTASDTLRRLHHSEGLVTRELLDRVIRPGDYDYYLCGPTPFMKVVYGLLRQGGVRKKRIAYEFFGPATVLEEDVAAADSLPRPPSTPPPLPPTRPLPLGGVDALAPAAAPRPRADSLAATIPAPISVEFRKSGRKLPWNPEAKSLLAFAEDFGLKPDFSCRAGVCSTCKTRILAGKVAYFEEPLDPPGDGEVLICCSKPVTAVVLDL
jgi:ferredoxin-NADP reductase/ferredoxin